MIIKRKKKIEGLFSKFYVTQSASSSPDMVKEKTNYFLSIPALLGIKIHPLGFLILFLSGLVLLWFMGWVFFDNWVMSSLMLGAMIYLFFMLVQSRIKAKEELFTKQLPDTLSAVANSLKAGFSLDQSFEFVSESMPEPTKSEFSRVHMNYRVGFTLAEALTDLSKKYPNTEVMLFVSSMVLQNQVGGNVIPFLVELGKIIRERIKLKNQISVGTAQVRLSALIIAIIPYFLLVLLHFSGYRALTETLRGFLLLCFAILLQMTGMTIISTFMKLDI